MEDDQEDERRRRRRRRRRSGRKVNRILFHLPASQWLADIKDVGGDANVSEKIIDFFCKKKNNKNEI